MFSWKFRVAFRVQPEPPEKSRKMYRPKRCEYNNKNQDNCPNMLNKISIKNKYERLMNVILQPLNIN